MARFTDGVIPPTASPEAITDKLASKQTAAYKKQYSELKINLAAQTKLYREAISKREELEKKYQDSLKKGKQDEINEARKTLTEQVDLVKKLNLEKENAERSFNEHVAQLNQQKFEILRTQEMNQLQYMSRLERKSHQENRAEELKNTKKQHETLTKFVKDATKRQNEIKKQLLDESLSAEARSQLEAEQEVLAERLKASEDTISKIELDVDMSNIEKDIQNIKIDLEAAYTPSEKVAAKQKELEDLRIKNAEKLWEIEQKHGKNSEEYKKAAKDAQKKESTAEKEVAKAEDDAKKAEGKGEDKKSKKASAAINQGLAAMGAATANIESTLMSIYGQQGKINARLQGAKSLSGEEILYQDMIQKVKDNVGMSGVVSQKAVVEKIGTLVDSGVAYNVELRAYLEAMKDNIASTFSAFDSNLLRLIRLQQKDSTAHRLGMEAALTELFNKYFSDTSYLSQAFDQVSSALLEASSLLSAETAVEFEYVVQKWLGSLSSLGLSDETVGNLASGINLLATGNVEELSGHNMQALLVQAANQAAIPYAKILTEGLDASETNKLLQGIIEYLKTIVDNPDLNNVTRAAYAKLYGLTVSDFTAISSITDSEIQKLYETTMSYQDTYQSLVNQFSSLRDRIHLSTLIDTAIENAFTGAAASIGDSALTYGLWKTLNVVKDITGGIDIPFINVWGFGLDLNTTVVDLIKMGIAGVSLIGSLVSGIGEAFSDPKLDSWTLDTVTTRGDAMNLLSPNGVSSGLSSSSESRSAGSGSGSDMESSSLAEGAESANDKSSIINADTHSEVTIEDLYNTLAINETITVISQINKIVSILESWGGGGGSSTGGGSSSTSTSSISSSSTITALNNIHSALVSDQTNSINKQLTKIIDIISDNKSVSPVVTPVGGGSTSTTTVDVSTYIQNLEAENKALQTVINSLTSNGSSSGLSTTVSSMSPDMQRQLEQLITSALKSTMAVGGNPEDDFVTLFVEKLVQKLQYSTFDVRMVNTYIDAVLQRFAYGGSI